MFEYNLDKYLTNKYEKEIKDGCVYTEFKLKQNDYGEHKFLFSPLCDCDCDWCIIKFKLPNQDVVVSEMLYLTDGMFVYDISSSVVKYPGKVIAEISFYKENSRVSTTKFYFEIADDINTDNAISGDETSAFNDLIFQLGNTKKEVEESYRSFLDNDCEITDDKIHIFMKHNSVKRLDILDKTGIVADGFELKENGLLETDEGYLKMHTSELVFSTSENDFTFESEQNIVFTGLDCENKMFNPMSKTRYIITFYYDGADILAFVGGYDID